MVATACAQSSCIDQYGVYTKCLFTFVKRPKVTPARAQHVRTARRYPVLYGGTRLYRTIRFRDYGLGTTVTVPLVQPDPVRSLHRACRRPQPPCRDGRPLSAVDEHEGSFGRRSMR